LDSGDLTVASSTQIKIKPLGTNLAQTLMHLLQFILAVALILIVIIAH